MGDKIASKKLALQAKVNTIPGWNEAIETSERAVEIAKDIGYPVMIKASAGGGGKGLRVAYNDKEAFEGFSACRNEAKASFGDDRVFIEKFVESPRHIEIQVLADAHGNTLYLNERECSIQRRHQKVIEEAPSPFISEATRKAMGEQAVALAKAVNYQSAGTVEFVVGKDQSFYFLEMNTRLQVEHPVTECITGVDLVEQMIRVAAGEKLPFTQAAGAAQRLGHRMPHQRRRPVPRLPAVHRPAGALPAAADRRWKPPCRCPKAAACAWTPGVYEGGEIPMYYDSMIAKLIVHGRDRDDAIAKMREALNAFVIRGVASNIPFQAALLAHPKFVSGDFNTGFIAEHYAQGFRAEDVPHDDPDFLVALAAAAYRRYRERAAGISGQLAGHTAVVGDDFVVVVKGERGEHVHVPVRCIDAGRAHGGRGQWPAVRDRQRLALRRHTRQRQLQRRAVHGAGRAAAACGCASTHNGARIEAHGDERPGGRTAALMPFKAPPDLSKFLLSPMPGLLVGHRRQAGAEGAGRRAAGRDRGDEDGEHPDRGA